jgi:hypothetical protein
MDVRLARPTDAPLALALALDDRAHLVRNSGWPPCNPVARSVLRSLFPLALTGRTWIARDRGSVAILEAAPRRYVIGWDIARLAVRGDCSWVLGAVVQAATDHIRTRGVPRLFARCGDEPSAELKASGFTALCHEYVMTGTVGHTGGDEELSLDSRYRMPQDAWPLHQLESEVTPALVRQLEGLTSLDWSNKIRGMSEIVVEGDGRVVSWIGWGVKLPRGHTQIGMLVHPRYKEAGPELLAHVLRNAPPNTRFVARVRDYQNEALRAFSDAGFEVVAEEILMVKHARVELAKEARRRMKVAPAPSIHAFHNQLVESADGRRLRSNLPAGKAAS